MSKQIRVRGIRRKEVDEDKLAVAFLLLAKILHEQDEAAGNRPSTSEASPPERAGPEAEAA